LAPAAFADSVIVGNGAFSSNVVSTTDINTTTASQTNNTSVGTTVNSTASTGGNNSAFNTGGASTIVSGSASNTTNVSVLGGGNTLSLTGSCGCSNNASSALIAGNGAFSHNKVWSLNVNSLSATQTNNTVVGTTVNTKAKTGKNSSVFNTGPGGSAVITGGATNTTGVAVVTPSNSMTVTP
jgi:hypothetical protein